jgi:hypothetical protein
MNLFTRNIHTTIAGIRRFSGAVVVSASLTLAGCAGGGADTEINAVIGTAGLPDYTGEVPATADVQAFRVNLWDNIRTNNRCGACHSVEGGQSPMFARNDNVNLAYAEAAFPITNLQSPADSEMVTKVAGGHNCCAPTFSRRGSQPGLAIWRQAMVAALSFKRQAQFEIPARVNIFRWTQLSSVLPYTPF